MRGDPGGTATFRIDGYTADNPMKEESPGFYRAQVSIGRYLDIPSGVIRLILSKGGRRSFESIPEQITVVSKPQAKTGL
ncbi:hypothetical protein [Candidatus Cyanaurora vandensis]|uniref:hypothetical protein n=1 Tax=Candidatus Cyanaurora vandensis TaxID=2714958 RepID=UPI00257C6293|nr:hypothetical protein [Candidatus Cyanaurora vandensis]